MSDWLYIAFLALVTAIPLGLRRWRRREPVQSAYDLTTETSPAWIWEAVWLVGVIGAALLLTSFLPRVRW